ncbi:general transcription factor IIH subunit 3 [Ischnura elegans]|uniref:general transcription factor IIH subunit 3 n=1 Tax=Ischnura elegans TaxID=197161 RepID=UPI001ED88484|nr:general transcription factor IIH subunit 3 [Ischnura elegans]
MSDDVESSLLVVVIDTNPCQRIFSDVNHTLTQILESVVAFSNSHLMMKCNNKLAIIACHSKSSKYLYPSSCIGDDDISDDGDFRNMQQVDGQYELFTLVEKTVRKAVHRLIVSSEQDESNSMQGNGQESSSSKDSLLAGSLAMALCYIHRLNKENPSSKKMNSRILVITASGDSASQYMNFMNVFFTAQKCNVVMDVCSLDQDHSLLQQGCDITGGLYLKIPQLQGLLQYLLWVFLAEPPIRKKLVLPPPVKVDYRAACFCHRELIDIGYVCSICLSVFCKFSPICTTCHTVFKTAAPLPIRVKKKRIKLS